MARGLDWQSVSDIGGNILDSRDIEELIEELEAEKEASEEASTEYIEALGIYNGATEEERADMEEPDQPEPMDEDRAELLKCLRSMRDDVGSGEWPYGLTLIHDTYFEEYAQDLAEDCGMMDKEPQWPYTCIDWEKAAQELQYDYSSVDVDGQTYWYLSH